MSLEMCVLASGSGGNCTVLRTPAGVVLIDAGIGPRTAAARMNGTGAHVRDIAAICVTHLDRDHFSPGWANFIATRGVRVFCHRRCVVDVLEMLGDDLRQHIVGFDDPFEPVDGLYVEPIALAHDRAGSHGFLIEGFGCRVGYATDLGRVPAELVERFVDLDVLAIESNYDPLMQEHSARPNFLKQRIMGGRGHLSNEQALAAVRQILDRCERHGARLPAHIVLLHRSRQCNCPNLVRKLFSRDARIARRLTLAEQFERSGWLRSRPAPALVGEQLLLGWT
ncbi:MAG TPA: MBL fold metallo-hydrolase [Tepidisphaeraceae bacterium]|jgi:phosphoribosyl 1,2-cyclic phosphodiesterase|nr:MBL fold metallo-hydrolase [Tepidisphaeraceae bacterium]